MPRTGRGYTVQDPMKNQQPGAVMPMNPRVRPSYSQQSQQPTTTLPNARVNRRNRGQHLQRPSGGGGGGFALPGISDILSPIGDALDYGGDKLKQTGNFLGEQVGVDGLGNTINDGVNYVDDKIWDGVKGGFGGMKNLGGKGVRGIMDFFGGSKGSDPSTPPTGGDTSGPVPFEERPVQDFSYPEELMPYDDTKNELFDVSSKGILDSILGTDDFSKRNANMVQSSLDSMMGNNEASINRQAAEMGATPGSSAYNMLQNQNKGSILSQGSKLLSEMSNRNIEHRDDMLKTGATMGFNLDGMQRARKDQEFGQFMDAMGLSQFMPDDMVGELVKGKIGNSLNLSGKYRDNPNQFERMIEERAKGYIATGMSPEEANIEARKQVRNYIDTIPQLEAEYGKEQGTEGVSRDGKFKQAVDSVNPFDENFLNFGPVKIGDGIEAVGDGIIDGGKSIYDFVSFWD